MLQIPATKCFRRKNSVAVTTLTVSALLLHYSGKEALTDRLKQLVDTIASCQLDDVQEYHILCNCGVKDN